MPLFFAMYSWSGIAHFCQSRNSGLQALVDALFIEQLEIRVKNKNMTASLFIQDLIFND